MPLTVEDVVVQALARASEVAEIGPQPMARTVMYRRVGVAQQRLFLLAARANLEYFGVCATAVLDASGQADLADIATPVPTPELIQRIAIDDPGTSAYAAGTQVHLVSVADPDVANAPRMTLRDHVLRAVGDDLAQVTSVVVYYSRLPAAFGAGDGPKVVEVPEPFDELLVLDLTRWLLARSPLTNPARDTALASVEAEAAQLLDDFLAHVGRFGPVEARFARPPAAPAAAAREAAKR